MSVLQHDIGFHCTVYFFFVLSPLRSFSWLRIRISSSSSSQQQQRRSFGRNENEWKSGFNGTAFLCETRIRYSKKYILKQLLSTISLLLVPWGNSIDHLNLENLLKTYSSMKIFDIENWKILALLVHRYCLIIMRISWEGHGALWLLLFLSTRTKAYMRFADARWCTLRLRKILFYLETELANLKILKNN